MVYTPASTPVAYDAWPTYQELINSGKRVVAFLSAGADTSSVPYLLDEFTNIWETPFDVSGAHHSAEKLADAASMAANRRLVPLHGGSRDGFCRGQDGALLPLFS